jgi:trehalose transport system permease protein
MTGQAMDRPDERNVGAETLVQPQSNPAVAAGTLGAMGKLQYEPPSAGRRFLRRNALTIVMILPLALYIFGFTLLPVFDSIRLSFEDRFTGEFPTTSNYRDIADDTNFGRAVRNTIGITAIGVTLELLFGLAIALMLARAFRGRGFFRSMVLIPLGVPTLVAGAAMIYILGLQGYLNEILLRLNIIDQQILWTQSGWRGMFSIAVADTWKTTPLVILILLAGLESIPGDIYEAADVDGASKWRQFWDHTLPLLMPAITMAIILRAIDAFRIFDIAIVLAGNQVPVMSSFVYFEYFNGNLNGASAAATMLLLMIIVFVVAYFLIVERRRGEA